MTEKTYDFKSYKSDENKTITTIIHASGVLSLAGIQKCQAGTEAIWFIYAMIMTALGYFYWYSTNICVHRQCSIMDVYNTISNSEIDSKNDYKNKYLKPWNNICLSNQLKCTVFVVLSYLFSIFGFLNFYIYQLNFEVRQMYVHISLLLLLTILISYTILSIYKLHQKTFV